MEIEMIQCQSHAWVPIVNGTLLHSSVDPFKEARQFVDQIWDRVCHVQNVIVFGLGGGYHLEELIRRGKTQIFVVEACHDLVAAVLEKNPSLAQRVHIISQINPQDIIHDTELLKAIAHSYGIVYHPPSIGLNKSYYQQVSDCLSQRTLRRLRELTKENAPLNRFFQSVDLSEHQVITLPMIEQAMKRNGSTLDREGLIWMTLRELVV